MKYAGMVLALSALFTSLAPAQITPIKPPPRPDDMRPSLTTQDGKDSKPLRLAKADVHVVITGFMAETTMTLTFHNDLSRVLEGELTFPLPQGATISGYGLDVNGQMVDGVPVEKQQARVAFESEVRKGVDPGLVEHVKGNNFRTRVYPIPSRGDRTIKVQYLSELNTAGEDVSYLLPTSWGDEPVGEYHLLVEMVQPVCEPTLKSAPAELTFQKQGNRTLAEKSFKDIKLTRDLVISLPNPPKQTSVVEKRIADEKAQYYFAINDLPIPAEVQKAKRAVGRVGIAWDASLSRAEGDKSRELEIIKALCRAYPGMSIDLVVFRNVAEEPVTFNIQNGDASPLLDHLSKLTYDGGTNFSDLRFAKDPQELIRGAWQLNHPTYAFWLLFTDGLVDLFLDAPKSVQAPVYAISNDSRSNHDLLSHLSQSSGGQYFNLKRVSNEQVVASLGQTPFSLLKVEFDPAQVAEVYPQGVQPVMGRVALSGRLLSPEAKVTLHYGYGANVTQSVSYTLKQAEASESGLAARCWAQQKVADLSANAEKNHDAILALGREFGLVTPNTSLMVLENLAQYLQYNITPPKSRPEIYNAYVSQIAQVNEAKKKNEVQKLDRVLAMWNARVAWWEKKHEVSVATAELRNTAHARPLPASQPQLAQDQTDQVVQQLAREDDGRDEREARLRQPRELALRGTRDRAGQAATSGDSAASGQQQGGGGQGLFGSTSARSSDQDGTRGGRGFGGRGGGGGGFGGGGVGGGGLGGVPTTPNNPLPGAGKAMDGEERASGATISIKAWDPETPYLILLREAAPAKAYSVYLQQRTQFGSSPAFYLDCADFFLQKNDHPTAIRILTNIAELRLENAPLLRVAAHRLMQLTEHDLAIDLFEKVLQLRPEEPQSHRDLALALEARALANPNSMMAHADCRRSAKLLEHVVMGTWDGRFPEIEVMALEELNDLLAKAKSMPQDKPIIADLDPRLLKLLDLDVRIVMTWDADATDIDLWVTEPSGEKCYYQHNRTTIGGLLSNDFTQGYGPEEYCVRNAMKGEYKIQANFYGSRQQSLTGPTTIQATVITHFGRPDEKRQSLTVRLATQKEVVDLGTVKVD
jgi:Ca-activated chloride channel family protein